MNNSEVFVRNMLSINDKYGSLFSPPPSFVRITTITALSKLCIEGIETIDMDKLRSIFANDLKIRRKGAEETFTVWSIKDNGFYNQVTLEFFDSYSKKSIKIFPNCTVHLTGGSSVYNNEVVRRQILCIFSKYFGKTTCEPFKIVMINTNFSVNSVLNLSAIIENMKKKGCIVTFNPETYSAVKAKFSPGPNMKQVTASIFSSGKVIITGATNMNEITSSYEFILDAVQADTKTRLKPVETPDVFDEFMGYSISTQLRSHLVKNVDSL
jgi:TATA-box binding protein (TBP) (component of TFIID and TFIIIB)